MSSTEWGGKMGVSPKTVKPGSRAVWWDKSSGLAKQAGIPAVLARPCPGERRGISPQVASGRGGDIGIISESSSCVKGGNLV